MDTRTQEALEQLCERVGLATRYLDCWNREQQVPAETLRALLQALGHSAGSDEAVRHSLTHVVEAEAGALLPPVLVLLQGNGQRLELHLPEGRRLAWQLEAENGERLQGELDRQSWLRLPEGLPLGYHELRLSQDGEPLARTTVIVCPERCWRPPAIEAGERLWGLCVQLYALRSSRNWGIGDFSDLQQLLQTAAALGASFVGLNPLHALFLHAPHQASPYSPSNRCLLNVLYLDVEAIDGYAECEAAARHVQSQAFQQRLQALRESPLVDYPGVAAVKLEVLERLYAHFRAVALSRGSEEALAFRGFQQERGPLLRHQALFEALQAHFHRQDPAMWGWPAWPEAFRDRGSEAVAAFEAEQIERVEFYEYLQWQADVQLQAAATRAEQLGMALGLYRDLAVGSNEGGAETWSSPGLYAGGVHVGAPPDELNPGGQDWGLPPPRPDALRQAAYQPFVQTLRSNMRSAGALRLDHVMALRRLFWIPSGREGGAYVHYRIDELMAIVALESVRQRCLVIGEDLGTVPPEVQQAMQRFGVFSYCPLYFAHDESGGFRSPAAWKSEALAVAGTHDLPTLRGFWRGEDIALRRRLGLYPSETAFSRHSVDRAADRTRLLLALEAEGLQPPGEAARPAAAEPTPELTAAVYELLGRTASQLVGVQLEDVLLQLEQVNLPGTTEERWPNWRRKLEVGLEQLGHDWRLLAVAGALSRSRKQPAAAAAAALPALETALVPRATYRLQLHSGFSFEQAREIVPYLDALGASHLYSSSYLKARAGSTHGYDIVDHNALNPEIGSEQDFERLCASLTERGMHQLLDIVPNHMGVLQADNAWWLDVLEHGPASEHAETFDIDWQPPAPELAGRVLLPVLGGPYGEVLERGELRLSFDAERGEFRLGYYDHRFPIDPRDYGRIVRGVPAPPPQDTTQAEALHAVESLLDAFGRLPDRNDTRPEARATRHRDQALLKRQLAERSRAWSWFATWIEASVRELNGQPGQASSFDALDALIRRQAYRLAYWRVAGDEVNYRRFFDINTLAAVRMERESVFEASHRTLLRWLAEGRIAGLRIDHPDGLADPCGYFTRLQAHHAALQRPAEGESPRALYLVIEKILAEHERWPASWPVHGDTGYRFANQVNGLFVDGRAAADFDRLYAAFIGTPLDFDELLYAAKRAIIETSLAADLQMLTDAAHRICQRDRRARDFTRNALKAALTELAAAFPVYRTYIGEGEVDPIDREHLDWATATARRRSSEAAAATLDHLRELMLHAGTEPDPQQRSALLAFVTRFQQFTAPVMAKAMEDTAFYRYHRLVSLNDVGGDPRQFGTTVAAFHVANQTRARFMPHTLLGSSTHDSKRSEDLRARIDVLSELPGLWEETLQRWRALAERQLPSLDGGQAPDANDQYLLYQTLFGVWPLQTPDAAQLEALRERVQAYMQKAVREAKQHTSWIDPNPDYEAGLERFIDALLRQPAPNPFLGELQSFVQALAPFGCYNSLSLVALKLTSPGVPDIYQGCETWNFSLVDPDNRRPVDFAGLQAALEGLQGLCAPAGTPEPLAALPDAALAQLRRELADGRLKLLLTWRLLQLRRREPELFERGRYQPLEARGPAAEHLVAFCRERGRAACITIATRLLHRLSGGRPQALGDAATWEDTALLLPAGFQGRRWRDAITGRTVEAAGQDGGLPLATLLSALPVAVLVPDDRSGPLPAPDRVP
ncbi:malto-oligosyltrehalose synthase [Aquabacterium sp. A7-Y]|uniref:malto-oligosyltrehalose synthase n=1 Tax=Aquabacterium sp. A7-Y TaxID=1349605 RepID=UPI00223D453E|nr:malto-oligosyltrehalose synthase [Aquabacterium sp. A7-Y]MCW7540610.1 malto-oligosyltrehalose synthase [Aquabacterium sp. A7-Y]